MQEISAKYEKFDDLVRQGKVLSNNKSTSNIAGFINGLLKIKQNDSGGAFLTSKIAYLVSCFLPKTHLFDEIGRDIECSIFEKHRELINDCFLVSKKLKTGTDNLLCLYDGSTKTKNRFIDVSHIDETLKLEQSYIPEFYVYIKWNNKDYVDNDTIMMLRKELGAIVADQTKKFIDDNFMKYLQYK